MVILLAGSEQFLKEEELAKIKCALLDKESEKFNFNVFYAGSASAQEILECANTFPFLGRQRLVLVPQVQKLSAADKKLLLSYIKTPQKRTCLVLETSETDLRHNFFAEVCRYSQVIFCRPLRDNQLLGWIKAQAEARGKSIESKAQLLLIDNLDSDLKALSNALDSLILYIGERKVIEAGDVQRLVGKDLSTSAFELFDALMVGHNARAFSVLDNLLKDGVNSSLILGALAHKMLTQRDRINSPTLEGGLEELQRADRQIKTGRQSPRLALELLLARLLKLP